MKNVDLSELIVTSQEMREFRKRPAPKIEFELCGESPNRWWEANHESCFFIDRSGGSLNGFFCRIFKYQENGMMESTVEQEVTEEKAEYEVENSTEGDQESTQVESADEPATDPDPYHEPDDHEPEDHEPEDTPLSDAENQLCLISNAERVCSAREADVDEAKEQLKFAKSDYDCSVSKLRNLAAQFNNDADRPLLNQDNPKADSTTDPEPEKVDDGWTALCISSLWESEIKGLGKAKREALVDDVTTLGGFEHLRSAVGSDADHLSKLLPSGIGEKLADELENRHLDFVAKYGNSDEPADSEDESADFIKQLEDRIAELEKGSDEWWVEEDDPDAKGCGESDFACGLDLKDCPEDFGTTNLDDWLRGWCSAKAISKLEVETDKLEESIASDDDSEEEYTDVDEL